MNHFHRIVGSLALLAVAGCGEALDRHDEFGGGGKADEAFACDPGRTCLDVRRYDVVFTNPVCPRYDYDEPVPTADGQGLRFGKPENVYCSTADAAAAGARPESPQSRLVEWIDTTGADDWIVLSALSFSDEVIFEALCTTTADVTFIVNRASALSDRLEGECGPNKEVLLRGSTGGVGYAHIKLVAINPDRSGPSDPDDETVRIAFGSGNMSAGTHLHHENWHFLEVARATYFAENHRCLIESLIHEPDTADRGAFRDALARCRARIDYPEEDDIKAMFVPALEDRRKAFELAAGGLDRAGSVDIAVHRFTHRELVDRMVARMSSDDAFAIRMVADDDLYWLSPLSGRGAQVGHNDWFEADIIAELQQADPTHDEHQISRFSTGAFQIKYMETRHADLQLHHNKFILYRDMPERDGVLCGAANLSKSGFESNLENIYYIEIPHVVAAFEAQFDRFWDGRRLSHDEPTPPQATAPEKMPAFDLQP